LIGVDRALDFAPERIVARGLCRDRDVLLLADLRLDAPLYLRPLVPRARLAADLDLLHAAQAVALELLGGVGRFGHAQNDRVDRVLAVPLAKRPAQALLDALKLRVGVL